MRLFTISIFLLFFSLQSCVSQSKSEKEQIIRMTSGLKYTDHKVGDGKSPVAGQKVTVHYRGTLINGMEFDSSYSRNQPLSFIFGIGQVITGWDEGLKTMQVGGKRQLVIPPHLAYGTKAIGDIPANATLIFEIELIDIQE